MKRRFGPANWCNVQNLRYVGVVMITHAQLSEYCDIEARPIDDDVCSTTLCCMQ